MDYWDRMTFVRKSFVISLQNEEQATLMIELSKKYKACRQQKREKATNDALRDLPTACIEI